MVKTGLKPVRSSAEVQVHDHDDRRPRRSSDNFVGVVMMDLTQSPVRTATVGIAVYPDALLLDAYEERARQDAEDEVARVRNAVVSYHGPFTGRLAVGERLVERCVR